MLPPNIGSLIHWDHPVGKFADNAHEIARTRHPGDILREVVARSHCLHGIRGVPMKAVQPTPRAFVCTTNAVCADDMWNPYMLGSAGNQVMKGYQRLCGCRDRQWAWHTSNMGIHSKASIFALRQSQAQTKTGHGSMRASHHNSFTKRSGSSLSARGGATKETGKKQEAKSVAVAVAAEKK